MLDATGGQSYGLLAEAASLAESMGATAAGIGDLRAYLDAYYRHADGDELMAAGPLRVGAVAAEHARLAASRPQGRALVRVSAAGTSTAVPATITPASLISIGPVGEVMVSVGALVSMGSIGPGLVPFR